MELVRLNYESYHKVREEISKQLEENQSVSLERGNLMLVRITNELLNLFSAIRTFLDHSQTSLDREFGKTSGELDKFNTARTGEFDANFSYRFLYQLRNFTQHCGLPIGEFRLGVNPDPSNLQAALATVECFFKRDYLLSNFNKWGKHVEPELVKMPEEFPIEPHVESVFAAVERIESTLISIQGDGLERHLGVLEAFANEVKHLDGCPCVYNSILKMQDGSLRANYQRIYLDTLQLIRGQLAVPQP